MARKVGDAFILSLEAQFIELKYFLTRGDHSFWRELHGYYRWRRISLKYLVSPIEFVLLGRWSERQAGRQA